MIKLLPFIFFPSLLPATVTNTATLTIGEGVTMRVDGDFVNEGSVINNGTFSISGTLTGEIIQNEGSIMGYFGGAEIPAGYYENLLIEGDAVLGDYIMIGGNLTLQEGTLSTGGDIMGGGYNASLYGSFIQENGTLSGYGYIIGDKTTGLGLIIDTDTTHIVGLNGQALYNYGVGGLSKHYLLGTNAEGSINITLSYRDDELNGLVEDDLTLFHSTDEWAEEWTYKGGVVNTETNTITVDAENINGYWTAGQVGCALDGALSEYTYGESVNSDPGAFYGENECQYHFQVLLHGGANLVSFFGIQEDVSVSNMLSSLEYIEGIMGEGVGAIIIDGNWFGSLTEISQDEGYWIKLSEDDMLDFIGKAADPSIEVCIHPGNNLIGYPLILPGPIEAAVPDNAESCLLAVAGEGMAALQNNDDGWVGSLTEFFPWNGYWFVNICMEDICFEFEGGDYVLPRETAVEIPKEYSFTQSSKQAFYFIQGIEEAIEGDFVVALSGDKIVGSAPYMGVNTTIPVMGDDGNQYSFDYAMENDRIELMLISGDREYRLNTGVLHFENMGITQLGMLQSLAIIPESFALHSAYPNPFNPSTNIKFDLPEDINVSLEVYNINGRLIGELKRGIMDAGYHSVIWNANCVASGMYFVKLHAGTFIKTQKLMLVK